MMQPDFLVLQSQNEVFSTDTKSEKRQGDNISNALESDDVSEGINADFLSTLVEITKSREQGTGNRDQGSGIRDQSAEEAESIELKAESVEPKAESSKLKAESPELRVESTKQRAESTELKAESSELKAESPEFKVQSMVSEPKAQNLEQKGEDVWFRMQDSGGKVQNSEFKFQSSEETESSHQKSESIEFKSESSKQKSESLELRVESSGQKSESLEQRAASTQQQSGRLKLETESSQQKSESIEFKSESSKQKAESPEFRVESSKFKAESSNLRVESRNQKADGPKLEVESLELKAEESETPASKSGAQSLNPNSQQAGEVAKNLTLNPATQEMAPKIESNFQNITAISDNMENFDKNFSDKEPDNAPLFQERQSFSRVSDTSLQAKETQLFQKPLQTEVLTQIVKKAVFDLKKGKTEVKIDLKPEFLGRIQLKISTENHQVMIKILTELPMVKDMIENNINHLKADLQNHGLEIDKFDVLLAHDSDQYKNKHENAESLKKNGKIGTGEADSSLDREMEAEAQFAEERKGANLIGVFA